MPIRALLGVLAPPLCWGCHRPCRARDPLCIRCRAELRWLDPEPAVLDGLPVWAPVAYSGPARALVRGLKFSGAAGLAEPMAAAIVATAPAGMLGGALVPVPLAVRRQRRRGYNQADVLAHAVARRTGLPLAGVLERRATAPQVGRGRQDRLAAQRGTVTIRAGASAPARAVLVDDVDTTGATLAAAAATLREAGTHRVDALAYARTPAR